MNACDFCKASWIAAAVIALMLGVVFGIQGIANAGRDSICFEAQLWHNHLDNCDDSKYPTKGEHYDPTAKR